VPALEEPPSVEKTLPRNPDEPDIVGALVSGVLVAEAVPKTVEGPGMPDPDACFPNRPYVLAAGDAVLILNRPASFAGGLVSKTEAGGVNVGLSVLKLNDGTCCATGSVVVTGAAFEGGRAGVTTGEEGVAPPSHQVVRLRDAQPEYSGGRLTRSRLTV
jgi:hypothetical protein